MDLLPAILGAQNYNTAIKQVQATREGMTREEAWAEISRVVVSMGWALLVAPELWMALSAWWRIQRLADAIERADATCERLKLAIDEPETLLIVETSKEDQPLRIGTTEGAPSIIRTLKVGPDILSVRSKALFDGTNAIARTEDAQARAETAFRRAVEAYQASLIDIAALPPQAIAARLLTGSWRAQDMATCRALLEVAARPEDASGDETMAALAKHPAILAARP